jgi:oligosaccharide repeat unit polymerase
MAIIAYIVLIIACVAIMLFGLRQPNGYMKLPFLISVVFLIWVMPQLWSLHQVYSAEVHDNLLNLNLICLFCLLATIWGWNLGEGSPAKLTSRHQPISDQTLVNICIAITALAVVMSVAIGSRALEERAASNWSGPLAIMYFFSGLKVISAFLSLYLFLKNRNSIALVLLMTNIFLYAPLVFIAFRRRAVIEVFTCIVLALWFARRIIIPRILIILAIPMGMLLVFGVGQLRRLSLTESGERTWVALSDIAKVDFLAATPFVDSQKAPELNNALNLVRLFDEYGIQTYGATSWNHFIFQWVPGQLLGFETKQALMIGEDISHKIVERYEDIRVGTTPTAMGEAYMEFWFFGAVFFFVMAFLMGRWWTQSHQGNRIAMILYASGLATAIIMPTAYAFYFLNVILLYGGAVYGGVKVFAVHRPPSGIRRGTHKWGYRKRTRSNDG